MVPQGNPVLVDKSPQNFVTVKNKYVETQIETRRRIGQLDYDYDLLSKPRPKLLEPFYCPKPLQSVKKVPQFMSVVESN
jgi:uncharacterized protein VirK/YbjX